jgi:hypothetical protein
MIRASITTEGDSLEPLRNIATAYPDTIREWAKRHLRPFVSQEVGKRLGQEPGGVHYPIEWTSERQRMAFFATDGFGKGIPYTRTGKLAKSWHVRGDYRNGIAAINVFNTAPSAKYVYGDERGRHQQQFHINTGWPRLVDQMQVIGILTTDRIEDALPGLLFDTLRHGPSGRGRAR